MTTVEVVVVVEGGFASFLGSKEEAIVDSGREEWRFGDVTVGAGFRENTNPTPKQDPVRLME